MNQLFRQMTSNMIKQQLSNQTRQMFNSMYQTNPQLFNQLNQMKQSGMSVEEILQQNGISMDQFNNFKNQLR